ncbi:hypothetical protein N7G274_002816 [Stereocaulon virgatum]|uniref:RBR-type E3 ubiquitin transferase n=1 Tax=Stereocaulon virgatum TaxID=373712 RepID=A0ABR4AHP9_9LECA
MRTLPPRVPYSSMTRKLTSRRVDRETNSSSHRSTKHATSGLSSTADVGVTKRDQLVSSTSYSNPEEVHYRWYRTSMPDQQLNRDFELACNLAAGELPEDERAGFWTNYYDQQLQYKAQTSRRKQDAWYDEVVDQNRRRETIRREHILQDREGREQILRAETDAYYRVQEERTAHRRARYAAAAQQQRMDLDELQRAREEAEAARRAQQAGEEERRRRQAEEAERRRRELERQCTVCLEPGDMWAMIETSCGHWYCREDLQSAFQVGLESRTPFQCCQRAVPIEDLLGLFDDDFRDRYSELVLELSTPNAVYCSNRSCIRFIPPSQATGPDTMRCSHCRTATCRHCRNRSHSGTECHADVGTRQARALAEAQGWRACPSCTNVVEKSSGCLHMTCRCGTQFCYGCGAFYTRCQGGCRR